MTDLDLTYVGRPAVGWDHDGEILVSVLERTGGPLWLIDDGQATQLAPEAASVPAMRFLHGMLYVVARSAGHVQSYQVLARDQDGKWEAPVAVGTLPEAGGGPFMSMATSASGMGAGPAPHVGKASIGVH